MIKTVGLNFENSYFYIVLYFGIRIFKLASP